jgi:chemotaxis protein CheD
LVPKIQVPEEVVVIGIGEFRVSRRPLCSIGLGSCIGLVLHDPDWQIGGLAHILLPSSNGRSDRPGKYADTAIIALREELSRQRGKKGKITAKLSGGSSMFSQFSDNFSIGERNLEAVRIKLDEFSIPIVGEDVGGRVGRTITYFPNNGGKVTIRRGDGSVTEI